MGGGVVLNGPGASHIAGLGHDRIILSLAVHLADGMDRRKVHCIEAHIGHPLQCLGSGSKSAVDWISLFIPASRGARKELVPRAIQCGRALHIYLMDCALHQQVAQGMRVQDACYLLRERYLHALIDVQGLILQVPSGRKERFHHIRRGLQSRARKQICAMLQVIGELSSGLPSRYLLGYRVLPRGDGIGPGIDAEVPGALGARGKYAVHAILVIGINLHGDRGGSRGPCRPRRQGCRDRIVALAPDEGGDRNYLAYNGFGGYRTGGDKRADIVNTKARSHAHKTNAAVSISPGKEQISHNGRRERRNSH